MNIEQQANTEPTITETLVKAIVMNTDLKTATAIIATGAKQNSLILQFAIQAAYEKGQREKL